MAAHLGTSTAGSPRNDMDRQHPEALKNSCLPATSFLDDRVYHFLSIFLPRSPGAVTGTDYRPRSADLTFAIETP